MKQVLAIAICLLCSFAANAQTVEEWQEIERHRFIEMRTQDSLYAVRMVMDTTIMSRVIVRIVVNPKGKVISANVVRSRSTINDPGHVKLAEQRAKGILYAPVKTAKNEERVVLVTISN